MEKTIKYILRSVIIILLACTAFLCGVYVTEYKAIKQDHKSTVATIAVVNADNGVMVDGEQINYAEKLMSYPDVNFTASSLTEAREGVEHDAYAALILIPGTFSGSIQSINTKPEKAEITYAVNENLREDVKVKVVNDIHNFILNLSTNISYIYVDSILKEVHAVQNDSDSIMENDTKDMEAIRAVEEEELIAETEYVPIEVAETEIEYMDLDADYAAADKAVDGMLKTYEESTKKAEEAFMTIKDTSKGVTEASRTASDAIMAVDILTDDSGNSVYAEGEEKLSEYADQYGLTAKEKKLAAKTALGFTDPSVSANTAPQKTPLEQLQDKVGEQADVLKSISSNSIPTADKEKLNAAVSALEEFQNQTLKQYAETGIAAIEEIPDGTGMVSDVNKIINDDIAAKVSAECSKEADIVGKSTETLQKTIDDYITKLDAYDAMSYMDQDGISRQMSALYTAVSDMETKIMEQDESYIAYVDEVYATADKNVTALQESIETSNETTQEGET